ncbi:hypothetical protein [Bacillus marinisedimentorum]|nr:hypothetical protein [Bacillus marinisedimentorum]
MNIDQEKLVEIMKDLYYKGQNSGKHLSAQELVEEISGKLQTFSLK